MTPVDVPAVFAAMSDDLLISDHWSKLPPETPPWWQRGGNVVATFIADQKWRAWSYNDWLIALTFLTLSIGITEQIIRMAKAAR
jgi:hypothetical protein